MEVDQTLFISALNALQVILFEAISHLVATNNKVNKCQLISMPRNEASATIPKKMCTCYMIMDVPVIFVLEYKK